MKRKIGKSSFMLLLSYKKKKQTLNSTIAKLWLTESDIHSTKANISWFSSLPSPWEALCEIEMHGCAPHIFKWFSSLDGIVEERHRFKRHKKRWAVPLYMVSFLHVFAVCEGVLCHPSAMFRFTDFSNNKLLSDVEIFEAVGFLWFF